MRQPYIWLFIKFKAGHIEENKLKETIDRLPVINFFTLYPALVETYLYDKAIYDVYFSQSVIIGAAVLCAIAFINYKFKKRFILNITRILGILVFLYLIFISSNMPERNYMFITLCTVFSFLFYACDFAAYYSETDINALKIFKGAFISELIYSIAVCSFIYITWPINL